MRNKRILPIIVFSIFTASLVFHGCESNNKLSQSKPNILIILMDDLGYGDISCYSDKATPTPAIDKLSEEGVMCTDFYVPTPYCAPSRATILTGRFPLRHGVVRNPAPDAGINDIGIRNSEVLLGEVLQENGYRTGCIGKWHLGHTTEFFPVKHGFDEYFGILYSNDMRPVQIIENMDTVMSTVDQSILTKLYTERAIKFIKEHKNTSFFLHLCHAMPHKPLAASGNYYTPETPEDLYADVIREMDWSVKEVMDALQEEDLLRNTIVIFMSDNGATFGGNVLPLKGRKGSNWEGGVRVPFMIRYPRVLPEGKVIHTPCWSPDIFPTLLSLTGLKPPENTILDGKDITEILLGNQQDHDAIFTMKGNGIRTIRKGDWKLFLDKPRFYRSINLETWVDPRAPDGVSIIAPVEQATPAQYPGIRPEYMPGIRYLFNLSDDISEMKNQYEDNKEKAIELEDLYSEFMKTLDQ